MSSTALLLTIMGVLVSGGLLTCFVVFLMDGVSDRRANGKRSHHSNFLRT